MFEPRITLRALAALCRRLAVATTAGIDVRSVWRREAEHGPRALRGAAGRVAAAAASGNSVADALVTETYFPVLFRRMAAVGDETGNLAEVYRRLADHYEYQVSVRRNFLASLVWPLVQLTFAIFIVGFLIWFMGYAASSYGQNQKDLLGLGLMGTRGLAIYIAIVGGVAVLVALLVAAIRRGALWTKPLQRAALAIPAVGPALKTIALSRIAWTMQLALNTAMDVRLAMRLALESSGNDYYARLADPVAADLSAGREIHEALRRTGAFPHDFLSAIAVAEESGQLVESAGRLSRQYEDQAQAATKVLATLAGFAVWLAVASLIVLVIFRLAGVYFGTIRDAARGKF